MSDRAAGAPNTGRGGGLVRAAVLLRLALRNTRRQARRSLLTASAMVLGLALLMFSRALADGAHEQWIESAVRMGTGHVTVQAPGFRESGDLADRLDAARLRAVDAALADSALRASVLATSPRISISGLASSPGSAVPVRVEAVDPAREIDFSLLDDRITEGRYLKAGDRLAAYVGVDLADRLGIRVGSRFVLTAQAADGQVEGQMLRVAGLFRTGIPETDQGLLQIPLGTARSWLGVGEGATSVPILLRSSHETDDVVARLRARLGEAGPIRVLGWRQASPELASAVKIDDFGDYVFHGVLFAIVALAVLNSVLMAVLNRRREFGVLRALGLTARETGAVVFSEGLLLTFLSGAAGILLGFAVTWIFFRHGLDLSSFYNTDFTVSGGLIDPVIVPIFRPVQVLQSVAFILVIGVLASLYPARQARRIDVAEAMKFDR